jgi:hypothetical protein
MFSPLAATLFHGHSVRCSGNGPWKCVARYDVVDRARFPLIGASHAAPTPTRPEE